MIGLLALAPAPGGLGPVVHADLDDLIKGLVILAFFVGPALKSILDKVAAAGRDGAAPPKGAGSGRGTRTRPRGRTRAQPPTGAPTGSPLGSPGRTVTWEDLMRGDVPERPESASAELEDDGPELVAESAPGGSWSSEPRGREVLAEVPGEAELEERGVEAASLETTLDTSWTAAAGAHEIDEQRDELGGLDTSVLEDTLVAAEAARPTPVRRTRRGFHAAGTEGGWRRGILLAEVLGPPLALREPGSQPGPPLSQR